MPVIVQSDKQLETWARSRELRDVSWLICKWMQKYDKLFERYNVLKQQQMDTETHFRSVFLVQLKLTGMRLVGLQSGYEDQNTSDRNHTWATALVDCQLLEKKSQVQNFLIRCRTYPLTVFANLTVRSCCAAILFLLANSYKLQQRKSSASLRFLLLPEWRHICCLYWNNGTVAAYRQHTHWVGLSFG